MDYAEAFVGHYPNWGDAIEWVSDEVWGRHGLRRLWLPTVAHRISVDHDETFIVPEQVQG